MSWDVNKPNFYSFW